MIRSQHCNQGFLTSRRSVVWTIAVVAVALGGRRVGTQRCAQPLMGRHLLQWKCGTECRRVACRLMRFDATHISDGNTIWQCDVCACGVSVQQRRTFHHCWAIGERLSQWAGCGRVQLVCAWCIHMVVLGWLAEWGVGRGPAARFAAITQHPGAALGITSLGQLPATSLHLLPHTIGGWTGWARMVSRSHS